MPSQFDNAVTRRLALVQDRYRAAFPPDRTTGLCLWSVEPDEVQMIDAFVLTEDTPGAVFRDLFLSFFCEDAGAKERREERSGASLPRTWKEQGDVLRSQLLAREAELKEQGFPEAGFRPPPLIKGINDFLRYVHRVTSQMHNLRGRTVVYLNPTKVTDKRAFLTAIQHALETGLPDNQILMVHAPPEDLAHQMLGPRDDLGVVTIEADLDMGAVAEELAADGDPGDPALRYRTLFVELNRHGQARNYGKMREAGDLALAVADQTPGWEHLSVTILAAQGSHLLTDRSRQEEALAFFVRARPRRRGSRTNRKPFRPRRDATGPPIRSSGLSSPEALAGSRRMLRGRARLGRGGAGPSLSALRNPPHGRVVPPASR